MIDITRRNMTIVDRLREDGSDLAIEAADKIESLRRRGKHWEKRAKRENAKYWRAMLDRDCEKKEGEK